MIIENSFDVPLPPDRALEILTDVPAIAPCIPGVTLNESLGEGAYKGTAAVRLGPVSLSFGGEARITNIDREANTAKVEAEGADQKGRGRASAQVVFALEPSGVGTKVNVRSDVMLSGQVAQYGRASGLINEVANQIIADFAKNLENMLAGQAGASAKSPQDAASQAEAPAGKPAANEISGFRLVWRALIAMIARVFKGEGRGR